MTVRTPRAAWASVTPLLLVVPLGAFAAACGDDGEDEDLAAEVTAAGAFPVGYRAFTGAEGVSYARAGGDETRTLDAFVWYPAQATAGDTPASYVVSGVVTLSTDVAFDGAAVADGGPFPVAVYSHGSGGEGLLAYPYGEHLASHGWVVVSVSHRGNTALDGLMGTTSPFNQMVLDRPNDVTAALDWLESGLGADPLAGVADTGRVLLFGHSFGGYTTFAAAGADLDLDTLAARCDGVAEPSPSCALLDDAAWNAAVAAGFGDPRIDAIVPQAPALVALPAEELAALPLPVMLQTGRRDQSTTQETSALPSWQGTDGPDDVWIDMPDAGHFSFISICDDLDPSLLTAFRPDAPSDGCGPTFTPASEVVDALAAYTLVWGRRHVLGEQRLDRVLEGPPLHPSFVVHTR